VPAEIAPAELARIVDFAERSRLGDWSLRSALCRYAQPQPKRVSEVLEVVRRIEAALQPQAKRLVKEGPELWAALEGGGAAAGDDVQLVGVLAAARELDRLGDTMADWAEARHGKHPEDEVDATAAEVARRLDELGVPREERMRPPPGARSRG
jgi:hypothetical protein